MISMMRLYGYEVSELDRPPRIQTECKAEVWSAKLEARSFEGTNHGKRKSFE
jgi:hypothetical protein